MDLVNRIARCGICGSETLKIRPGSGFISYYCDKCNREVENRKYYKYRTYFPICSKCKGEFFKAVFKIQNEEGEDIWETKCVNCGSEPEVVFVDNDGNFFENNEQKNLFLDSKTDELIEEYNNNSMLLNKYEKEVRYNNQMIEQIELEKKIIKEKIERNNKKIQKIHRELKEILKDLREDKNN